MVDFAFQHTTLIIAVSYLLLEIAAIVAAVHAVMHVRTAQGASAWLIGLLTMPFIALPLYGLFGRRKFTGYVNARRADNAAIKQMTDQLREPGQPPEQGSIVHYSDRHLGFEKIAGSSFLSANDASLLVDGAATFEAIFSAIDAAENYVLVQFYIIRADNLGTELKQHLLDCLSRGVRVHFLYDAIGSFDLSSRYVTELSQAGAFVSSFTSTTRRMRKLQVNFRNHRKIVVVDGHTSFIGGHNVGDEYLGDDPRLSPWRDTHVRVHGPVAASTQIPFVEDWYWSTGELPEISWDAVVGEANQSALSLPSGPADEVEAGALMFVHAINSARTRLWIVSPYFVPNGSIIDALKLAALREVDVRILLPTLNDNALVQLAGRAYLPELIPSGVRIFHYTKGFLHQKVMLIDDDLATIGTANLDNRSMRLNFEVTLIFAGEVFAAQVASMLTEDFKQSVEADAVTISGESWWSRLASRAARLLAPVL